MDEKREAGSCSLQKWPLWLSSPVPSSLSSAIHPPDFQQFCSDRTKRLPCSFVHFLFNRLIRREGTDNKRKTPRNEQKSIIFVFLIEGRKGSENRRRTKNKSIVVEYFMPSPLVPFLPLGRRKNEGRNKQQILRGATSQSSTLASLVSLLWLSPYQEFLCKDANHPTAMSSLFSLLALSLSLSLSPSSLVSLLLVLPRDGLGQGWNLRPP